jgi:hypothetical protein
MSPRDFSFEQTSVMRSAIDKVLVHLEVPTESSLRSEVGHLVLSIFNQGDEHDANALAALTIEKIAEQNGKTA